MFAQDIAFVGNSITKSNYNILNVKIFDIGNELEVADTPRLLLAYVSD